MLKVLQYYDFFTLFKKTNFVYGFFHIMMTISKPYHLFEIINSFYHSFSK